MNGAVDLLVTEVLFRVATITLAIGAGLAFANLAVAYGLVDVVASVGRYLTLPANLPDEVGTAVLTNAVSVTAGYAMLAEFRESALLDDRATLVAVVVNTFFGYVQHIFTYYLPVLVPILGLQVGLLYVGARAGISLSITLVGILAGALLLRGYEYDRSGLELAVGGDDEGSARHRHRLCEAGSKTVDRLRSIVPRLLVVYTLVVVGLETADLESMTAVAEPLTGVLGLPGAAVPVIVVATVDPTSGAIALAPMIGEVFTPTEAVITLLIGSLFSLTVGTVKRSIPFQYGIWGAEFGTKVILVNVGLKAAFIVLAIVCFLVV